MNGPDPIQPETIKGWMELFNVKLNRGEVQLVLDMDRAYRNALALEQERNRPQREPTENRSRPRARSRR